MYNLSLLNPFVFAYMIDLCCINWSWAVLVSSQHSLHMVELRENTCSNLVLFYVFLRKWEKGKTW